MMPGALRGMAGLIMWCLEIRLEQNSRMNQEVSLMGGFDLYSWGWERPEQGKWRDLGGGGLANALVYLSEHYFLNQKPIYLAGNESKDAS